MWAKIDELITNGEVGATEELYQELKKKGDDVFKWVQARKKALLVAHIPAIQTAATAILASHPKLVNPDRNRSGADPFVIAVAQVNGCAVVSGERPSTSLKKPKVPDVCKALGVTCISLVELMRQQNWTW